MLYIIVFFMLWYESRMTEYFANLMLLLNDYVGDFRGALLGYIALVEDGALPAVTE